MSARSLGLLIAVTALVVAAAVFLAHEERNGIPARGQRLFPDLLDQVNQVHEVTVTTANGSVTITRGEEAWVVKEKERYPAAMDKVRPLLIGLASLTILEPTTTNPALYEKLGLRDVTTEGASSTLVTLKGPEGSSMARLLIGTRRTSRADPSRDELYVRKPADAQTWLAVGRVRPETTPDGWIDKQILDIDTQRVRRVRITHPDGETLTIRKETQDDTDFVLLGVSEDAEARSRFSVNNIADTVAHLTLDDVLAASETPFDPKESTTVVLETFDGLRVRLQLRERAGIHHATASAQFDERLIEAETPPADSGADPSPGDPAPSAGEAKTAEQVEQEADRLQRRFAGWVWVIPDRRAETIATRREALLTDRSTG